MSENGSTFAARNGADINTRSGVNESRFASPIPASGSKCHHDPLGPPESSPACDDGSDGCDSVEDVGVPQRFPLSNERHRPPPSPSYAPAPPSSPWHCFGLNPHLLTAMISNFSTSYNVVNISLVLPMLQNLYPPRNNEDAAALASSLLAGMMVGQVAGGALGDSCVGRLGALGIVMALQILASLASSVLHPSAGSNESHGNIYLQLAACRFLLGIGAGGVYPLAAVLSAEQGDEEKREQQQREDDSHDQNQVGVAPAKHVMPEVEPSNRLSTGPQSQSETSIGDQEIHEEDESKQVHRVVLTFSTQGLGFVMVPIVAVILLSTMDNLDLVWRIMLGIGSFPGIGLMIFQWQLYLMRRSAVDASFVSLLTDEELGANGNETEHSTLPSDVMPEDEPEQSDGILRDSSVHGQRRGFWNSIRNEPGLGKKLIGTAGAWFLFDVLFYGNTLFQPIVIETAFGNATGSPIEMLRKTSINSLLLTSIALPGYVVAGLLMGKRTGCVTQTPRYVMMQGFAAMAMLYLTIGMQWNFLRRCPSALVVLYGSTFFFANYGPNTTTFLLPSMMYSPECRSTLNGISAAAGKFGALIGAALFAPAADKWGNAIVMQMCAGVAALSFFVTLVFVPARGGRH